MAGRMEKGKVLLETSSLRAMSPGSRSAMKTSASARKLE
jgi:hypothetical protein